APTAVATVTAIGADTGSSASDYITSTASQTVSGTFTGTLDPDKSSQNSTDRTTTYATATPSGSTWSASGVTLAADANTLSVRTLGSAGNRAVHSFPTRRPSELAPTAVATVTAIGADTGSSASDYITSTASQTVSGTFTGT